MQSSSRCVCCVSRLSGLPCFSQWNSDDIVLGRHGKYHFSPLYRVASSARTAHLYVIGLSGKGKSKFLERCLYQDIAAGRGCGLIDPHSLLVDDLLRLLATQGVLDDSDVRKRLIYVDPPVRITSSPLVSWRLKLSIRTTCLTDCITLDQKDHGLHICKCDGAIVLAAQGHLKSLCLTYVLYRRRPSERHRLRYNGR